MKRILYERALGNQAKVSAYGGKAHVIWFYEIARIEYNVALDREAEFTRIDSISAYSSRNNVIGHLLKKYPDESLDICHLMTDFYYLIFQLLNSGFDRSRDACLTFLSSVNFSRNDARKEAIDIYIDLEKFGEIAVEAVLSSSMG